VKSRARSGARVRRRRRDVLQRDLAVHQAELATQNAQLVGAQVALEASRARYADLYDYAPVGYCTLDRDGRIHEINLRGAALFGYPRELVLGKHLRTLFPQVSRAALDSHLRQCLRRDGAHTVELTLERGAVSAVELSSVATSAAPGSRDACLTTIADITSRRLAEAERARLLDEARAAQARAEVANRAKDEFLTVISHELRSPVATLLMWTHLARVNAGDPALRTQALDAIELSTRSQLKLLEDLLDLGRICTGKLRLDRKPLPLASVVEAAILGARPFAVAAGLTLSSAVPTDLGVVRGDEVRLGEVFGNLITNAIKFSIPGGAIVVRATAGRESATIEVVDQGQGIAPDVLPHVFDLFRQGDGTRGTARAGLGVGLAIVKELVEAHGGSVTAASPGPGKGTTMTVHLPIAAREADEPRPTLIVPAGRVVVAQGRPLAGLDLLVVEDDDDMRSVMTGVLRLHGAEVSAAASLAEGRALLQRAPPGMLVSDIGLPDGEGYALVRELRADEQRRGGHTPALALTSRVLDRDRSLAAGFDQHLGKPVEAEVLVWCISALAAQHQSLAVRRSA